MITYYFTLVERGVEAQKYLLRSLLGLRRVETEGEKISVHVLARLLEQLPYLIPDFRGGFVFPDKTHEFVTQRIGWHHGICSEP